MVFAALDLEWLQGVYYAPPRELLPEGATWTKIDGKGTVLVTGTKIDGNVTKPRGLSRTGKVAVGEPLPEKSLLQDFLARKNGVTNAMDPRGISVSMPSSPPAARSWRET